MTSFSKAPASPYSQVHPQPRLGHLSLSTKSSSNRQPASTAMSTAHSIYDIRHLSPPSASLLSQLRAGLSGHKWIGDEAATSSWRYKKSLPTMLLYDEEGLKLYEK